jgi:hypothetical protein
MTAGVKGALRVVVLASWDEPEQRLDLGAGESRHELRI